MTAVPPQQKNLFTKHWSTKLPEIPEYRIQIALVAELRWRLRDDVEMYHVPNGELRNKRTAAKIKAMGGKPGISDLVFRWGPPLQVLYLELKARRRKPTPEQMAFGARAINHGAHFRWADNIDDAMRIIQQFGLLKDGLRSQFPSPAPQNF